MNDNSPPLNPRQPEISTKDVGKSTKMKIPRTLMSGQSRTPPDHSDALPTSRSSSPRTPRFAPPQLLQIPSLDFTTNQGDWKNLRSTFVSSPACLHALTERSTNHPNTNAPTGFLWFLLYRHCITALHQTSLSRCIRQSTENSVIFFIEQIFI